MNYKTKTSEPQRQRRGLNYILPMEKVVTTSHIVLAKCCGFFFQGVVSKVPSFNTDFETSSRLFYAFFRDLCYTHMPDFDPLRTQLRVYLYSLNKEEKKSEFRGGESKGENLLPCCNDPSLSSVSATFLEVQSPSCSPSVGQAKLKQRLCELEWGNQPQNFNQLSSRSKEDRFLQNTFLIEKETPSQVRILVLKSHQIFWFGRECSVPSRKTKWYTFQDLSTFSSTPPRMRISPFVLTEQRTLQSQGLNQPNQDQSQIPSQGQNQTKRKKSSDRERSFNFSDLHSWHQTKGDARKKEKKTKTTVSTKEKTNQTNPKNKNTEGKTTKTVTTVATNTVGFLSPNPEIEREWESILSQSSVIGNVNKISSLSVSGTKNHHIHLFDGRRQSSPECEEI